MRLFLYQAVHDIRICVIGSVNLVGSEVISMTIVYYNGISYVITKVGSFSDVAPWLHGRPSSP